VRGPTRRSTRYRLPKISRTMTPAPHPPAYRPERRSVLADGHKAHSTSPSLLRSRRSPRLGPRPTGSRERTDRAEHKKHAQPRHRRRLAHRISRASPHRAPLPPDQRRTARRAGLGLKKPRSRAATATSTRAAATGRAGLGPRPSNFRGDARAAPHKARRPLGRGPAATKRPPEAARVEPLGRGMSVMPQQETRPASVRARARPTKAGTQTFGRFVKYDVEHGGAQAAQVARRVDGRRSSRGRAARDRMQPQGRW